MRRRNTDVKNRGFLVETPLTERRLRVSYNNYVTYAQAVFLASPYGLGASDNFSIEFMVNVEIVCNAQSYRKLVRRYIVGNDK
jgi:hypothetical protein